MSMFGGMEISASALTAQRLRMNVTAENLANAQTTRGADGQPYRRKEVVLQSVAQGGFGAQLGAAMGSSSGRPGGVEVAAINEDQTNGKLVYDPSHPDANEQGYVRMPNVDTVTEMVDLIDAQRAYEANVTAMQASKQMFAKTLEILR
ncbi:MAG TPA: flagellar basal body rod protein FlgC [Solirubrobacter sp.]|nr:flagellar basal body rod protein FlgC [Solirubrobacter sp.]